MTQVKKFPKQTPIYNDGNDSTGIKRLHERMFGAGSWDELEKGVFARHPEFAPGGIYYDEPKPVKLPSRHWWQFWKAKSNVVAFKSRGSL